MKRTHRSLSVVGLVLWIGSLSVVAAGPITFGSLLEEMVDRDRIARFPDPEYTCRQFSSYDRGMVSPEDKEGWFANGDFSQFLGVEERDGRREWVMMDVDGPGCIVRIWCTGPDIRGTLRIYVDGQDSPVISGKAVDLIGGIALVGEPLSAVRARGQNLYLPIPYARHCKVTYDGPNFWETRKNEDPFYYQINYRTYAPGTAVESFSPAAFKRDRQVLQRVQRLLLAPWETVPADNAVRTESLTMTKEDSQPLVITGSRAICRMTVQLDAADLEKATRTTVLVMECDGEQTVWAPVGEFFGSGLGANPYRGWWRMVAKDGTMTCYWPMPFEKQCTIRLLFLGDQPVRATLGVQSKPWTWDDRSMHFRANWRHRYPVESQPHFDWNYITIQGRGVLVGDTLALMNGVMGWWGEGDEKIYIDGESFPSHVGTGTEDYYGYAYCTPEFFEDPFHAQPRADGPRNFGRVTNTRSRSLDAIPFHTSLRFDLELWHWEKTTMAYATTTYWYARPGATCNIQPDPEEAAKGPAPVPSLWKDVPGAIEGEGLKIRRVTGGTTEVQFIPQFGWSGGRQLWWRDGKVGDTLEIEVPVDKAGRRVLKVQLTKAPDYGIVQLSWDGRKVGPAIDLYHTGVVTSGEIELGTFALEAGTHVLGVEIVGTNPKAIARHMFGLDYLKLETPGGQ